MDIGLWVQVAVHIGPSGILRKLLGLSRITVLLDHLGVLVSEIDLVVEEVLGVGQILHSPRMLLCLLVLGNILVILDLLSLSGFDLINRVRLEALKVVWHVSVLS